MEKELEALLAGLSDRELAAVALDRAYIAYDGGQLFYNPLGGGVVEANTFYAPVTPRLERLLAEVQADYARRHGEAPDLLAHPEPLLGDRDAVRRLAEGVRADLREGLARLKREYDDRVAERLRIGADTE